MYRVMLRKRPLVSRYYLGCPPRCLDLDLDLSLNCQAPCGYHGNEVCAHYGRVFGASWLLKEGTEAAVVMVSFKVFHWTTVLGANDSWYAVWWQRIVLSLLVVTLPLTGLVLSSKSKSDGDTATCWFRILYMKVRRHILRRSSRDSSRSWVSREVTLMSRPYWLVIQLPALLWTLLSLSLFFSRCGSHTEQAYSRPDLTNAMYANFLRSCGLPFRFLLMNPNFWLALVVILLMCRDHDRSLVSVTPRYFSLSTDCKMVPHSS